jgi:hypothetical protein
VKSVPRLGAVKGVARVDGSVVVWGEDALALAVGRAQEGEELLVFGGSERDALVVVVVVTVGGGVELGGEVAQAVRDPAVEDARVPGLVELALGKLGGGGGARVPEVAAVGGGDGGGDAGVGGLDDGVEEDEGAEEARVGECEERAVGGV